jgi:rRNA maturation RNase YbeY
MTFSMLLANTLSSSTSSLNSASSGALSGAASCILNADSIVLQAQDFTALHALPGSKESNLSGFEQCPVWQKARSEQHPFTIEYLLEPTLEPALLKQQLDWPALKAALCPLLNQLPTAFLAVYGWETVLKHLQSHVATSALQQLTADVTFCDDATMQALNWQARQKQSATDVLSFPTWEQALLPATTQPHDEGNGFPLLALPEVTLGSIVVSVEWAWHHSLQQAQSKPMALTHALTQESLCVFLIERVSHGLLHLCGQHHATPESYKRVLALQAAVLEALNLPVALSALQNQE